MTFVQNGQVGFVSANLTAIQPLAVSAWIDVCAVPSWFSVEPTWVGAMNSNGDFIGIWNVVGGMLRVFVHNQNCSNVITSGVLMRV